MDIIFDGGWKCQIGTCWLGWFKESAVRRVLGLPRKTQIDVMIAMGFPAENDPLRPKLRKPLTEVARFSGK